MGSIPENEMTTVLLIDDDHDEALTLSRFLNKNDYRVYVADTLESAQKLIVLKNIDAVLLALRQPNSASFRFITELSSNKDDAGIPIIVLLEHSKEDLAVSALTAGAADFITFPLEFQELIERIGIQIRMRMYSPESKSKRGGGLARFMTRFLGGVFSRSVTQDIIGGRYEKLGRLGIGSFGEVWKVKDVVEIPPSIYVAKVPLSKNYNARIEKEARILKRLSDHSCVPKYREIIEDKNKAILIQEFVVGKTLYEVIERELTNKEVASVVIQLVDVVAYAHDREIIHRDIKPGNVMVRPDGSITLLDFGVAKELKGKAFSETVTGSRPYMSPEQIMGKSQRRSDVWAIGVVMYVLYTGMFPFFHEVEKILMDMILEIPPSPPSKFNESLDQTIERIIMKCLEKKPENRYPDAKALMDDLLTSIPDYGKMILPLYTPDDLILRATP
jgi:CheY-like chemotaxis protein